MKINFDVLPLLVAVCSSMTYSGSFQSSMASYEGIKETV